MVSQTQFMYIGELGDYVGEIKEHALNRNNREVAIEMSRNLVNQLNKIEKVFKITENQI